MRRGLICDWLVLALIACILVLGTGVASASAQSTPRILARAHLTVSGGGDVNTRNGWNLYVPPHVLRRAGYGEIVSVGHGIVDIRIAAPWHGQVEVTAPLRRASEVVSHDLGGIWVSESNAEGQRTVWVSQLSPFSLSGLLHDARDALCLTSLDPIDLLGCLATIGISWIEGKVVSWVVSKVSRSCEASLIANGISAGSSKKVPTAVVKGLLLGSACSGSASSPGAGDTSTGSSGPPIPVSGVPVNNGSLQGPTVNPQGSTTNPQPGTPSNPAPTPPSNPAPTPPPSSTEGFFIEDDIYWGTWARTDPDSGTWYPHSTPPPNGAYWYPNGLGVAVSCAESAAPYEVVVRGVHETWSWWAHVTDGKWVPTVVFSTVWSDGLPAGLSTC